jgi:putative resolvase
MNDEKYITSSAIRRNYSVSNATLINWAAAGRVRHLRLSEHGKRIHHSGDIARALGIPVDAAPAAPDRRHICYARVSSAKQAADLERQAEALAAAEPGHELVKEIGSGINWKRPKFLAILDAVMRGEVAEIVVADRDRIARFAFDLINHICRQFECRIMVLRKADSRGAVGGPTVDAAEEGNPISAANDQELAEDLIAVVTCFTASHHGRRSAENRRNRAAAAAAAVPATDETTSADEEEVDGGHTRGRHGGDRESSGGSEEDEKDPDLPGPEPKKRARKLVRNPPPRL